MIVKQRLDSCVARLYPDYSKTKIQSWIKTGNVRVNGMAITKPGTAITSDVSITVEVQNPPYVSRAGVKLAHALTQFRLDVTGLVALDAGLSTGGFTDCLLQHGIAKVYGVDVGHGQVHEKIKNDPRVIAMERTNLRMLMALPELVDLATLDLSFISVLKVIDRVANLIKKDGKLIVLIKPQFEAGPEYIGSGGIIKDSKTHAMVVENVTAGIQAHGFEHQGTLDSPILGGDGNKEFLSLFVKK